jgi:glycosyltransferase involved in cell wall biosynthesis
VQVLLSTYNGRRYLSELLASILRQREVAVEVLARDDGSTDGTWEFLEAQGQTVPLTAYRGSHLGVVASFFWLLQHSSPEADYIALADQDDVWLESKLARAVEVLRPRGTATPAMYCSRLTLVDPALTLLGHSEDAPRGPSFENSLVQNIANGCTIVLNQAARKVLGKGYPASAFMHDWWIYQVIAGLGTVVYDRESHILYRQHGGNAVGASHTTLGRVASRVWRGLRRGFRLFPPSQLEELQRIHGSDLDPARRLILQRYLDAHHAFGRRVRLATGSDLVFQHGWQQMMFRCLVLLNRL